MNLPVESILIPAKYKGERNYIHGTDIFNFLIQNISNISFPIKMKLHKKSCHELRAILTKNHITQKNKPVGFFKTGIGESSLIYVLTETQKKVSERYNYNEQNILAKGVFYKDIAILENHTGYSFIENIVAINKKLLDLNFNNQRLKWFFTQISLEKIPSSKGKSKLHLNSHLGTKLVSTDIYSDGIKIGNINFTGVIEDDRD